MSMDRSESIRLIDPREAYPKPPFKDQTRQKLPGSSDQMSPVPDHGEQSYRGSGKLRGLRALVTGGDSGIGRAIALCFAREGCHVAINYLSEGDDGRQSLDWIQQAGVKGCAIEGDLRDESFCESLVERSAEQLGGLDILINNAGYQVTRDAIDEFSTEVFDRIFKTNIYANFWLCRAALRRLPPGGSIINTASIQAYEPSGFLLPYAVTKTALLGMTKAVSKLAINRGVRVNAVAPGPVWTPLIPASIPKEHYERFGADTLIQRPAQPIELAPLYVWLASPEASYVTGEVFGCTGGKTPV